MKMTQRKQIVVKVLETQKGKKEQKNIQMQNEKETKKRGALTIPWQNQFRRVFETDFATDTTPWQVGNESSIRKRT